MIPQKKGCGGVFLLTGNAMSSLNKLLFFVLILAAVFWALGSNADPDLWGHIKFGLDTLEKGSLLRQDIYSYSAYGSEWINHEWLSEVVFALIYKNSGVPGLVLFKFIIAIFTLFLIFKLISLQAKFIFEKSLMFLLVSFQLAPFLSMLRPQIFTFLFAAVYMYIFYRMLREKVSWKFLVWLPLIMVLWTNLHGGFLAGLGLLLLFVVTYTIDKKCFDLRLFPV